MCNLPGSLHLHDRPRTDGPDRVWGLLEGQGGGMIEKCYLHWSATPYTWKEPGHYHSVVTGDGVVHRLTDYKTELYEHTYGRNRNSTSLALACMGEGGWSDYPPTPAQIDSMCKEVAKIALGLGWEANATFLKKRVMTHAEAAANRDCPLELAAQFSNKYPSSSWDHAAQAAGLPHANYGPSSWSDGWPGGDVFRWDLWQLRPTDKGGSGGFELRDKIVAWMKKIQAR